MKNIVKTNARDELILLKRRIEMTEKKLGYTNEPKLLDALCFELLSLRSRLGYIIDAAKQEQDI